jgi:hypothetical protein
VTPTKRHMRVFGVGFNLEPINKNKKHPKRVL